MSIVKGAHHRSVAAIGLAALLALGLDATPSWADKSANRVVSVEAEEEDGATTIAIRGTETPTFTVYKLERPARVVVDVAGARLDSRDAERDKAVWNVNTWAVGQVSAHTMDQGAGVVRVVVALARAGSYKVRARGNDVVVRVTPRERPPSRAADDGAAAERIARAEKMMKAAEERARQAEARVREAEAARAEAEKLARRATERQRAAARAEERAAARQREADQAMAAARSARAEAERADASEAAELRARAEKAARAAEQRREKAERAARLAERRRSEAERAAKLAGARRAEAESAAADAARRADELKEVAAAAARRAEELQGVAAAAAERAADARRLRQREEKALAQAKDARRRADSERERAEKARAHADAERERAEKARERLAAEVAALRRAEDEAAGRRRAAEAARAEAERAARERRVDGEELARLRREASRLAAERERADAELAAKKKALSARRAEAERLDGRRDRAAAELAKIEKAAAAARAEREREEERLAALASKRRQAERDLKEARDSRAAAEAALARAKKLEAEAAAARAEQQRVAQAESKRAAAARRAAPRVREVELVQQPGADRVVIALSAPARPRVIENRGTKAVLVIPGASIPDAQERTLDTAAFPGPVKAVSSYSDPKNPDDVRVVIELEEPTEGILRRVGTTYYWDFPRRERSASVAANDAPMQQRRARAADYPTAAVAGYGKASAPIRQKAVAQLARRQKTYRGKKIDLDYKDADIHNLMRLLADVGNVNIVVPDDIQARVTIRLRRVPWDQALDVILASKGLGYKLEGPGLYRIATQKELDEELERKLARARARAEAEAPEAEVFNLNYVDAASIQGQLQPLLSSKGRVEVEPRTNAVIINDLAANRQRIVQLLTRLDTQTPQIQIEARIVEARTSYSRAFGIQWGGNMSASAAGGNATGLIFPSRVQIAGGAQDAQTPLGGVAAPSDFAVNLPASVGTGAGGAIGLSLGSVGGNFNLALRLSAAEDTGNVRIISAPKITTSNNVDAEIKSGISIPISVISANGVNTQFVQADLSLKVKPTVSLRDCAVSMDIQVTKNEADFVNTGARGDPSILTKEANTTILVDDGETTVIGGIYTRNTGLAYSKVPFLADIPVLGWLFKNRQETDERSEVLVFITPKITNREALPCQ